MADNWNLAGVEPLNNTNYFLWREKIEGILRSKKLWKKIIGVKPPETPLEGDENYERKLRAWNDWDDDNYTARTIMLNTMTEAQLLKYSHERNAEKLWNLIKLNMAAETEQLKTRSLSELTNLKMKKDENVDDYVNRAEGLKNKCQQLGKNIEEYELKMFILRGLRTEFESNVRILESQANVTINDIRYALKQEEMRKERGREDRGNENVRKVREGTRNDINCFKCGKRGHYADKCRARQRCFNCNGTDHIAVECNKQRQFTTTRARGNSYSGNTRGRGYHGQRRGERMMRTTDESVMRVSESASANESVHKCDAKQDSDRNIVSYDNMRTIWLLDSGSTSHMSSDVDIFDWLKSDNREIALADKGGKKIASNGIGEIVMKQTNVQNKVRLSNVLHVPELNSNLLSVAKFTDRGYKVEFDKKGAVVYKDKNLIEMRAEREGNGYYVKTDIISGEKVKVVKENDVWHRRLGHVSKDLIAQMRAQDLVSGLKIVSEKYGQCEACVQGKACQKTHHRLEKRRAEKIMDLWHTDLIGPVRPATKGGKNYIMTVIDDYSRFVFVSLLYEKGEAANELIKLIKQKENGTGMKLKAIRSDNGGEFNSKNLREWLENKGIKHEFSPAYTPQCNGLIERMNRSIIEITRSIISDCEIPMDFWGEAVCTATHIKNRVITSVHGRTPYELWVGRKPNVGYMKRFGCVAYVLIKGAAKRKFDTKTMTGIFVGYGTNNTYRVYIPEKNKVQCTCDVKFDEKRNGVEILKGKEIEDHNGRNHLIFIGLDNEDDEDGLERDTESDINMREQNDSENDESGILEEPSEEDSTRGDNINEEEIGQNLQDNIQRSATIGRPRGTTSEVMEVRRQLEREEQREKEMRMNLRRSNRIKDKNSAMIVMDEEIPTNIEQAKNSSHWNEWKRAMDEEMECIKRHEVWDIVPCPKDKKIIRSKWIYSLKENPGTKEPRYKARLVAVGCTQRPGFDYGETFAPVARIESIRLLLSIAAEKGKRVKMYDVKTAFLHGELKDEIYMKTPDGYGHKENTVCKLKKSIYGLKQAGKCWNECLTGVMIKSGMCQSKEDQCLFYKIEGQKFLYCAIYVDDMVVVSSNIDIEKYYMNRVGSKINLKCLGDAKYILGMQVEQENGRVYVHQQDYIKKLLIMYGMDECNSVSTPIDVNIKMDNYADSNKCNTKEYQELVGRLMFLSVNTRPDITFTLSYLSQYNNDAREMHMKGLKRVLRYLKGTINYCLCYGGKTIQNRIDCETDASWDTTKDAKSFTGTLVYRNGDLIQWRSKKQYTVALSSTESELEAMLEGMKDVIWLDRLLREITGENKITKEIKSDSLNVVKLANGGNYKSRSKLLNRKFHFIREGMKENNILITHVASVDMRADCLTKALSGPKLYKNVKEIMDISLQ